MKLVQLEGAKEVFEKIKKPVEDLAKVRKLKEEIKEIKERIEKILKKSPNLAKKYGNDFEDWKKEAEAVLGNSELKGLDIAPAVVIGAGAVALTGAGLLINKLLSVKKKGLELKERILNDPELTFEQKKALLEAGTQSEKIQDTGSSVVWVFALAIVFIMMMYALGGLNAFKGFRKEA
jgi:DNA repair exonuclease SbcCD ATPase subunit